MLRNTFTNFKRVCVFTFLPRVWRGHIVKCNHGKFQKLSCTLFSTGKTTKSTDKDRDRREQIVKYLFSKTETCQGKTTDNQEKHDKEPAIILFTHDAEPFDKKIDIPSLRRQLNERATHDEADPFDRKIDVPSLRRQLSQRASEPFEGKIDPENLRTIEVGNPFDIADERKVVEEHRRNVDIPEALESPHIPEAYYNSNKSLSKKSNQNQNEIDPFDKKVDAILLATSKLIKEEKDALSRKGVVHASSTRDTKYEKTLEQKIEELKEPTVVEAGKTNEELQIRTPQELTNTLSEPKTRSTVMLMRDLVSRPSSVGSKIFQTQLVNSTTKPPSDNKKMSSAKGKTAKGATETPTSQTANPLSDHKKEEANSGGLIDIEPSSPPVQLAAAETTKIVATDLKSFQEQINESSVPQLTPDTASIDREISLPVTESQVNEDLEKDFSSAHDIEEQNIEEREMKEDNIDKQNTEEQMIEKTFDKQKIESLDAKLDLKTEKNVEPVSQSLKAVADATIRATDLNLSHAASDGTTLGPYEYDTKKPTIRKTTDGTQTGPTDDYDYYDIPDNPPGSSAEQQYKDIFTQNEGDEYSESLKLSTKEVTRMELTPGIDAKKKIDPILQVHSLQSRTYPAERQRSSYPGYPYMQDYMNPQGQGYYNEGQQGFSAPQASFDTPDQGYYNQQDYFSQQGQVQNYYSQQRHPNQQYGNQQQYRNPMDDFSTCVPNIPTNDKNRKVRSPFDNMELNPEKDFDVLKIAANQTTYKEPLQYRNSKNRNQASNAQSDLAPEFRNLTPPPVTWDFDSVAQFNLSQMYNQQYNEMNQYREIDMDLDDDDVDIDSEWHYDDTHMHRHRSINPYAYKNLYMLTNPNKNMNVYRRNPYRRRNRSRGYIPYSNIDPYAHMNSYGHMNPYGMFNNFANMNCLPNIGSASMYNVMASPLLKKSRLRDKRVNDTYPMPAITQQYPSQYNNPWSMQQDRNTTQNPVYQQTSMNVPQYTPGLKEQYSILNQFPGLLSPPSWEQINEIQQTWNEMQKGITGAQYQAWPQQAQISNYQSFSFPPPAVPNFHNVNFSETQSAQPFDPSNVMMQMQGNNQAIWNVYDPPLSQPQMQVQWQQPDANQTYGYPVESYENQFGNYESKPENYGHSTVNYGNYANLTSKNFAEQTNPMYANLGNENYAQPTNANYANQYDAIYANQPSSSYANQSNTNHANQRNENYASQNQTIEDSSKTNDNVPKQTNKINDKKSTTDSAKHAPDITTAIADKPKMTIPAKPNYNQSTDKHKAVVPDEESMYKNNHIKTTKIVAKKKKSKTQSLLTWFFGEPQEEKPIDAKPIFEPPPKSSSTTEETSSTIQKLSGNREQKSPGRRESVKNTVICELKPEVTAPVQDLELPIIRKKSVSSVSCQETKMKALDQNSDTVTFLPPETSEIKKESKFYHRLQENLFPERRESSVSQKDSLFEDRKTETSGRQREDPVSEEKTTKMSPARPKYKERFEEPLSISTDLSYPIIGGQQSVFPELKPRRAVRRRSVKRRRVVAKSNVDAVGKTTSDNVGKISSDIVGITDTHVVGRRETSIKMVKVTQLRPNTYTIIEPGIYKKQEIKEVMPQVGVKDIETESSIDIETLQNRTSSDGFGVTIPAFFDDSFQPLVRKPDKNSQSLIFTLSEAKKAKTRPISKGIVQEKASAKTCSRNNMPNAFLEPLTLSLSTMSPGSRNSDNIIKREITIDQTYMSEKIRSQIPTTVGPIPWCVEEKELSTSLKGIGLENKKTLPLTRSCSMYASLADPLEENDETTCGRKCCPPPCGPPPCPPPCCPKPKCPPPSPKCPPRKPKCPKPKPPCPCPCPPKPKCPTRKKNPCKY